MLAAVRGQLVARLTQSTCQQHMVLHPLSAATSVCFNLQGWCWPQHSSHWGNRTASGRCLSGSHTHTARAGFLIFALLYIWFTVLFLPTSTLLAACAGAIYGMLVAIPLVALCGGVLGETVSFLLGRLLLRNWVREWAADCWPNLVTALNAALKEDGWKLVALLRDITSGV